MHSTRAFAAAEQNKNLQTLGVKNSGRFSIHIIYDSMETQIPPQ